MTEPKRYLLVDADAAAFVVRHSPSLTRWLDVLRALTLQPDGDAVEVPEDLAPSDGRPLVMKAIIALIDCRKERDALRAEVERLKVACVVYQMDAAQAGALVISHEGTIERLRGDWQATLAREREYLTKFVRLEKVLRGEDEAANKAIRYHYLAVPDTQLEGFYEATIEETREVLRAAGRAAGVFVAGNEHFVCKPDEEKP